tara:strand:+ start:1439 stop:1780 length:342 start_codon:yes stop_codon:yes gene_type:complete
MSSEETTKNVCVSAESNFSVFVKTVVNYIIITAICLISVFTIFNMNNKIRELKNPVLKKALVVIAISLFTGVIGGLNPVAYDSIVIGVGLCLGFMLFANVAGIDLNKLVQNFA